MSEVLPMSNEDIDRLRVIREVLATKRSPAEAAEEFDLSDRQIRRLCVRVRDEGNRGILHRARGRPSNHQLAPELLEQALSSIHDPLWHDFGPTLATEELGERYDIKLSDWTIRKLMVLTGMWTGRRRRAKHRAWRERRRRVGMLVQLDGSDHDWLEGRGPRCVLVIYIDDATSRILHGEFVKVEDTMTLMRTTLTYLRKWGRPSAYYVDKDSIYSVNRKPTIDEQLNGQDPITQFTRAMGVLGIKVILANSPQAKGRVERGFRTHQDRLVKALRLAGISTMEDADKYLREAYIPKHNRRFAKQPAEPSDAHKPLLSSHDLDAILSFHADRTIHNDSIVQIDNRFLLIARDEDFRRRAKVVVEQRLDGTVRIAYSGRYLRFKEVEHRPHVPEQLRGAAREVPALPPPVVRPRSPFVGIGFGSCQPTNPPASAVLA